MCPQKSVFEMCAHLVLRCAHTLPQALRLPCRELCAYLNMSFALTSEQGVRTPQKEVVAYHVNTSVTGKNRNTCIFKAKDLGTCGLVVSGVFRIFATASGHNRS